VVLRRGIWIEEEQVRRVEEMFGKWVRVARDGDEEGLLVGLHDDKDVFLGMGIIDGIDYRRLAIKVFTSVSEKVSTIRVGQVKLDKNGSEIGLSQILT